MKLNEKELAELEAALREILVSSGLQWILDDIDEALSSGQPVLMRRQSRRASGGEVQLELIGPHEPPIPPDKELPAALRGTISTNIPFTRRQRVEITLSAVQRAATELPAVQEETLKIINTLNEDSRASVNEPQVESITFLSGDDAVGSEELPALSDLMDPSAAARRASLVRALSDLTEEIGP